MKAQVVRLPGQGRRGRPVAARESAHGASRDARPFWSSGGGGRDGGISKSRSKSSKSTDLRP